MKGKSIMITFDGQITGECWNQFKRQCKKETILMLSISSIIGIAVGVIISITIKSFLIQSIWWFAVCIAILFHTISLLVPIKANSRSNYHCKKISIDIDKATLYMNEGKKNHECLSLDDINIIYDYGEFYHIYDADITLYCQKSLLVEGTIEEFEKLFEGKIIKK